MRELIDSVMRFSMTMTLFGVQQFRNTVEGVVDATRWTFFTGFTCPDCGTQQEVARDLRQALNGVTKAMASQLQPDNRSSCENLSNAGTDIVSRGFAVVDAVYPILDDQPPPNGQPYPRGYEKRSSAPAFDPRRFVGMGEELLSTTTDQLSKMMVREKDQAKT